MTDSPPPRRTKTLRLTPDQAVTLAVWLRTAAATMRRHADELEAGARNHSLGAAMRKNAAIERHHADRAYALACRLNPEHQRILDRLASARATRERRRGR